MVARELLAGVTCVTMAAALLVMCFVFRYRRDKVVKASSPYLMCVLLVGTLLLYSEFLVASVSPTRVTCMLQPWLRLVGFTVMYGVLFLKTWRVSIIIRVFKSRQLFTKDTELLKKVIVLLIICASYLLLWTLADPTAPLADISNTTAVCRFQFWNVIATAAEVTLLGWGAYACHHAWRGPELYNESRQVSYAICIEFLWSVFYTFSRFYIERHKDADMLLYLQFLRVQGCVTVNICIIFVPKFIHLFRTVRELRGTLTDVYGVRQIHRFSLVVDKQGDVRSIHCVPCGPLAFIDEHDEFGSESDESIKYDNAKEDEYSKAEVDALIEMLSNLKNEKAAYKEEIKRLVALSRQCHVCSGRYDSATLLADTACSAWLAGHFGQLHGSALSPSYSELPSCSRDASTVTTRISSPADSMCIADIGSYIPPSTQGTAHKRSCSSPALHDKKIDSKRQPVCSRTQSAESLANCAFVGQNCHLSPSSSLTMLLSSFADDDHEVGLGSKTKKTAPRHSIYGRQLKLPKSKRRSDSKVNFIMHI